MLGPAAPHRIMDPFSDQNHTRKEEFPGAQARLKKIAKKKFIDESGTRTHAGFPTRSMNAKESLTWRHNHYFDINFRLSRIHAADLHSAISPLDLGVDNCYYK